MDASRLACHVRFLEGRDRQRHTGSRATDAAAGSGERAHQHDDLDQEGAGVRNRPRSAARGAARERAGAEPLQGFDLGDVACDEQSED